MFDYITVEEAAAKWNVTAQSVRSLCRAGRIPHVVKKGMMWFIPSDALHPSLRDKYTFSGTKRKIFLAAIRLFSAHSYDAITLKDIADETGIAQSAVYRHFESKAVILESIYVYFRHFFLANRPTIAELEPTLRNGTLKDIFHSVIYEFDPDHADYLVDCTKIVFQRMSYDERAREIFWTLLMKSGLDYVEEVFNQVIELGRLMKTDAYALSMLCNMSRLYVLLTALASNGDMSLVALANRCNDTLIDILVKGLTADQGEMFGLVEGAPDAPDAPVA